MENEVKITPEYVAEGIKNLFSICPDCVKNDVCKIKDEPQNEMCPYFVNACNYKRYGNIYDMFQPIFDWLKFHYPAGEVYFWVDNNSAKMMQNYRVVAFSKEITGFKYSDKRENENG